MRAAWLVLILGGCSAAVKPGNPCDQFDRTCLTANDCASLTHQLDCCGSQAFIGVAASTLSDSQAHEDACRATAPVCRCLARPPIAEDGLEVTTGGALLFDCRVGLCVSKTR